MRNITIVTAFFDINRKNCKIQELSRSNEQYLNYFEMWARMKNNLIVYTEEKMKEKILQIRRKFGLEDKTTVIVVDDIYDIEREIYNKMKEVEAKEHFKNFRYYNKAMSNTADYCYVMLLKYWALSDAKKRGLIYDLAAWLDFGFNHGGDCFINSDEFDYEWKYDFQDKIYCFAHSDPNEMLGVDSLQFQKDCIMGAPIILPKGKCEQLYENLKIAMKSLLMLDCIDDDQQLLLMVYKMNKQEFCIKKSDWFMPLKEYGGNHLSVKTKKTNNKKSCKIKRIIRNLIDTRIVFCRKKNYDFISRCKKRSTEYYK